MQIYEKINELGIQKVYSYVMLNNKSKYLPYHNNFHAEMVCGYALLIADNLKLSNDDTYLLAIAALFHDFNHTGSGKDDDKNIEIAVNAFIDFNNKELFLTAREMKFVIECIKATRFPYLTDGANLNNAQKCLRDADIFQGLFVQNYINGVVGAIAEESGKTLKEILEIQIGFLEKTTFLTEYAKTMSIEPLKEAITKCKTVKLIINSK